MPTETAELRRVLELLPGHRQQGDHYSAKCPAHDDRTASMTVKVGNNGSVLLHCFAGCSIVSICSALGLKQRDLFPPENSPSGNSNGNGKSAAPKIVAVYNYVDPDSGEILKRKVRMHPKKFFQQRPDGFGGWSNKGVDDVKSVLYRLPELNEAGFEEIVYLCNGEKAVERLRVANLIATCSAEGEGKGKWKNEYSEQLRGRRVAILQDNDKIGRTHCLYVASMLADFCEWVKIVALPGIPEKGDVYDFLAAGKTVEDLTSFVERCQVFKRPAPKQAVIIGTDEHRVASETVLALASDTDVYHRGGFLVHISREGSVGDIIRTAGSPTIVMMPLPFLRERITVNVDLLRYDQHGEIVPAHPPQWLSPAIHSRRNWPELRQLTAISDAPILRSDGTIHQSPGYDARTGVLYEPSISFPKISGSISRQDAIRHVESLYEVVKDFRFEKDIHRSAWLAGLLTPLARHAFSGPSPLFLIDANIRGAGKGMCAQTIGQIVLGRPTPVSGYIHDHVEFKKTITSFAIAGDPLVLLDNITGVFGNEALDRALTGERWSDRILGGNGMVNVALTAVWYATGNNVQVAADLARRLIHIRLDVLEEKPEEREDFEHADLAGWIARNRPELLASALAVLSGYIQAGRPEPSRKLTPFGSYEGWSGLVRQAIVWADQPDPCLTRAGLVESADSINDLVHQVVDAFHGYETPSVGIVISDLVSRLYPADRQYAPVTPDCVKMRAALEAVAGCRSGQVPSVRTISNRLKNFRRRVVDGKFLDVDRTLKGKSGVSWRVFYSKNQDEPGSAETLETLESHLRD
jgi:hypothetical protein